MEIQMTARFQVETKHPILILPETAREILTEAVREHVHDSLQGRKVPPPLAVKDLEINFIGTIEIEP